MPALVVSVWLSLALRSRGRSRTGRARRRRRGAAGTLEGRGLRTRREDLRGERRRAPGQLDARVRAAQALTQLMVVRTNGKCRSSTAAGHRCQPRRSGPTSARAALEHARARKRLKSAVTGRGSADRELLHVLRVEPRDHSLDLARAQAASTRRTPSASVDLDPKYDDAARASAACRHSTSCAHGHPRPRRALRAVSSAPRAPAPDSVRNSIRAPGVLGARRADSRARAPPTFERALRWAARHTSGCSATG